MARVLVTGASGFIGRALTPALVAAKYDVIGAYRTQALARTHGSFVCGEIGSDTDWARALDGVEAVVHLAGLAHTRHEERDLMRVNADGTRRLAEQAAQAGVRRFVLMSSVKAAADWSDRPLTEADTPAPASPYGRSKLEAERVVLALEPLRAVVLRPPLVHGADARSNFALLLRLAASPLPLPFGAARNRRSLVARTSLIEAILAVLARPEGPGGVFYVADRPALSTGAMIAALREGLGRAPGLFGASALERWAPHVMRESLELDDSRFRSAYAFAGQDSVRALAATALAWKTQAG